MPQNGNFLININFLDLFGVLEVKFQFLAGPPLKLKNNGGLLSAIFLWDASFKRYGWQGGLDVIKKFSKTLFGIVILSSKICITSLSYLFF